MYVQLVLKRCGRLVRAIGADPRPALQVLRLDRALCPRTGSEMTLRETFSFNARATFQALAAMELPEPSLLTAAGGTVEIHHPGGIGEILHVADGGSWLRGNIVEPNIDTSEVQFVAIA